MQGEDEQRDPTPGLTRRAVVDVAVVVGVASLVTVMMVGFGLAAERLGVHVHLVAVAALACPLGVVAAPPVRRAVERRTTGSAGPASLAVACVVVATLLCLLGLVVAVPVAVTVASVYTVLVDAGRGRVLSSTAVALATSLAALAAQGLGLVDGLLPFGTTLLLGLVLLAFTLPTVANAADVRRQVQLAADALEQERAAHLAELQRLALLDPLTGLFSRRGLAGPLARAAAATSATGCSGVVYLDLDGFKAVNDAHGHAAGDELLLAVAERLLLCVRPDDAVARVGGDEFVLVLEQLADAAEAEAIAERVRGELARQVLLTSGAVVTVGASAGVAVVDAPTTVKDLMARADAAMYDVKRASRRRRAEPLETPRGGVLPRP